MKVITSNNFERYKTGPVVVAIGSFDGLHIGHQKIINRTLYRARKEGFSSGVYSFKPHPLRILAPKKAPAKLLSRREKIKLLSSMGLDYYFEQEFTANFSRMNFQTFVKKILLGKLGVRHIVVGQDFRFGKNSTGNIKKLKKMSKNYDFNLTAIETIKNGQEKISSTGIRNLIKNGKLKHAAVDLGRNYSIEGVVVSGFGRGKKLGIPTANINLSVEYVLPPRGVYACYTHYQGKKYSSIANLGYKPTFTDNNYSIEVHIFDLEQDLYNKLLQVELVEFIRSEKKFNNTKELTSQIKNDILYTKKVLC